MKFIEAMREDGARLLINIEHIRMVIQIDDYIDVSFIGEDRFDPTRIEMNFEEFKKQLE